MITIKDTENVMITYCVNKYAAYIVPENEDDLTCCVKLAGCYKYSELVTHLREFYGITETMCTREAVYARNLAKRNEQAN